jgi:hypothetical protein
MGCWVAVVVIFGGGERGFGLRVEACLFLPLSFIHPLLLQPAIPSKEEGGQVNKTNFRHICE